MLVCLTGAIENKNEFNAVDEKQSERTHTNIICTYLRSYNCVLFFSWLFNFSYYTTINYRRTNQSNRTRHCFYVVGVCAPFRVTTLTCCLLSHYHEYINTYVNLLRFWTFICMYVCIYLHVN